ncbi:hypothetical protein SETIT_3G396000v2 [Setaria italica]|uniref:Uncharacterized protein n=2 Tax=Setaria TaxID=4554 RepID=A0A368QNL7_SETIT|nr:hypothetical protein SETIT_3G396000v2 [Setaria italica]TKW29713.1 hypothetical protein SEVIR_3G414100v2 [Setaria viridis]
MALLLAPCCGANAACDKWLSDRYQILLLCSSHTCNENCIARGRGHHQGEVWLTHLQVLLLLRQRMNVPA